MANTVFENKIIYGAVMNKNLLKHKKRALAVGTADQKCEAQPKQDLVTSFAGLPM